ncbi:ribosome hibernation-promoting factor, HPF/YfiA family [Rhodocaloribacter sp.]
MQTRITARHFRAHPKLQQYASDRLAKLERYYDGITFAHIVLARNSGQVQGEYAEITLNVYRQKLAAEESATTHEEAIDRCVERLRRQIVKYKAKLRDNSKDVHR